jgi:hypothetical protein
MKPKPLFILHFRPLENYPPVQNFLTYLATESVDITCISTNGDLTLGKYSEGIIIRRFGSITNGKIVLWFSYLLYNCSALLLLLYRRPSKVLYYESLSAFPAYMYKRYINRNAKVFIHYHEYTSVAEYAQSSIIERAFHKLEKYLYSNSVWISHTNKIRLNKFLTDNELKFNSEIHHFLPNYTLAQWGKQNEPWQKGELLKIVYVGYALDERSTFIREFVNWLKSTNLMIEFDVFLVKPSSLCSDLIGQFNSVNVQLQHAIPYKDLPNILQKYHIGVILYRGLNENYQFNAPNKLFEYLQCGLDVWYPKVMQGIVDYDTIDTPKVIGLDMTQLSQMCLETLLENSKFSLQTYSFEEVYRPLQLKLTQL